MNEHIWPNSFVGGTYEAESGFLKQWMLDRVSWMDRNIHLIGTAVKGNYSSQKIDVFPNPFNDELTINYLINFEGELEFVLRNLQGQTVAYATFDIEPGYDSQVIWNGIRPDGKPLAAGIYIYSFIRNGEVIANGKLSRY